MHRQKPGKEVQSVSADWRLVGNDIVQELLNDQLVAGIWLASNLRNKATLSGSICT